MSQIFSHACNSSGLFYIEMRVKEPQILQVYLLNTQFVSVYIYMNKYI